MNFLVHPQTGKRLAGLKLSETHAVGKRDVAWKAFNPSFNPFGSENPNRGQIVPDLQSTRVTTRTYLGQDSSRGLLEQPVFDFSIKHGRELKELGIAGVSVSHYVKTVNLPHADGSVPVLKVYSRIHDSQPSRTLTKPELAMIRGKLKAWHAEFVEELESRGMAVKPQG